MENNTLELYVDAINGDDANDGLTKETAFRTLSALRKACPGNIYCYLAGNFALEDANKVIADLKEAKREIIFDGNGGEAVIDCED